MGLFLQIQRLDGRNVRLYGDVYEEKYGEPLDGLEVMFTGPFDPMNQFTATVGTVEDEGVYSHVAEAINRSMNVTANLTPIDKSIDVKEIPDEAPFLLQGTLVADADPDKMRLLAAFTYPYDKSYCRVGVCPVGRPDLEEQYPGGWGAVDLVIDRAPLPAPVSYEIRAYSVFDLPSNPILQTL
jgi:hypothetical protein